MKKKQQVKKQIIPLYQPTQFWFYKTWTVQDLLNVDNFLTTFDKQLKAILIEQTLEDNYKIICEKIGYNVHPSLSKGKTTSQSENMQFQQYGDKYILIVNHKIDILTLKLLSYVHPLVKSNAIKFSNNNLTVEEIKLIQSLITKDQNTTVIFFQWNPIPDIQISKSIFPSLVKNNLKSLILRSNKIGNQVFKDLATKIIDSQDLKLKYLDLYDNDLSFQSIGVLRILLLSNKPIQHLDLSKNSIQSQETLKQFFDSIGLFSISQQQLQAHRLLQKQRDQIMQKNKKRKKNVPQQPLPIVPKIQQINQEWFYVRNNKLKSLNLSWNNISHSFSCIKQFINRVSIFNIEHPFLLNLTGNYLSQQQRDELKNIPGIKL